MRLQSARDQMIKMIHDSDLKTKYRKIWIDAHNLSAPSSTLPYPDTLAIATFSMMLGVVVSIDELKESLRNYSSSSSSNSTSS
jgi:hypothetical protein